MIIGAGPSGISSACYLSEIYNRVLLIDRQYFPRDKTCGGAISYKSIMLLKNDFHIDDSQLGKKFFGGAIYEKYNHIRDLNSNQYHLRMVMRKEFDQIILNKSIDHGVEFIQGINIHRIGEETGEIWIGEEKIIANKIVIADGTPSRMDKTLDLSNTSKNSGTVFGYEYNVDIELITNKQVLNLPSIYFGLVDSGYAWIFPKENYLTVGILDMKLSKKVLKNRLYELTRQMIPELDIGKIKLKGHWLPYDIPVKKLQSENIFLVGDAAGLADPILGEGIYYALLSGKLLTQALKADKPEMYSKLIKKQIGNDFKYGRLMRDVFYKPRITKKVLKLIGEHDQFADLLMNLVCGTISFRYLLFQSIISTPRVLVSSLFRKISAIKN